MSRPLSSALVGLAFCLSVLPAFAQFKPRTLDGLPVVADPKSEHLSALPLWYNRRWHPLTTTF